MPWSLVSGEGEGEGQQRYAASVGDILYLLQGKAGLTAAHSAPQDESLIVGTLGKLLPAAFDEQSSLSPTKLFSLILQSLKSQGMP